MSQQRGQGYSCWLFLSRLESNGQGKTIGQVHMRGVTLQQMRAVDVGMLIEGIWQGQLYMLLYFGQLRLLQRLFGHEVNEIG